MFIPRSHGVGYTLASQVWDAYYWHPLDADGYRGKSAGDAGGVRILLCGDSFTAGQGIRDVNRRYGNLLLSMLEDKLNKPVQIINLGVSGLDTPGEFAELKKYFSSGGQLPDLVVLQHYGNDIGETANRYGLFQESFRVSPEHAAGKALVQGSYAINFFYWLFPHHEDSSWWNDIRQAWKNEKLVQEHFRDIDSIAVYCRSLGTDIAVFTLPFMEDIPASRELYLSRVASFCSQHCIEWTDMSAALEKIPFRERVVSLSDTHADEPAQQVIADSLLNIILRVEKRSGNKKFRTKAELSDR